MTTVAYNGHTVNQNDPAMDRPRKRKHCWDQPLPGCIILPLASLRQANATLINQTINQSVNVRSPMTQLSGAITPMTSKLAHRIYVGALLYDITEDVIRAIFSPFGNVTKVDMPKEPGTTRSKGFCFVEFDRVEAAEAAQATMNGVMLKGRAMKIGKPTGGSQLTAEQQANLSINQPLTPQQAAEQAAHIAAAAGLPMQINQSINTLTISSTPTNRILISGFHPELVENDVIDLFSSFGAINKREFDAPHNRCVLEFADLAPAQSAVEHMDQFDLMGYKLKCQFLAPPIVQPIMPAYPSSTAFLPQQPVMPASYVQSLRSEEGIAISSHSQRTEVMQRLAASRSNQPSNVVLLSNMVDANQIDAELEGDVRSECEKFGQVNKIHIEPNHTNNTVAISVAFGSVAEASKAIESLNGRWFAGRTVQAQYTTWPAHAA